MRFIDEARIEVFAGRGGDGAASFRREKFVPFGGPDGGDGGDGGTVCLKVDSGLSTLLDFRYRRKYRASNGEPGRGSQCSGARGSDITLRVPVGTIVRDVESGELLGDLVHPGQKLCVARGGRGGRGNLHFVSSTNRTPRQVESGRAGEARELQLELKLIAQVGLIGYPNAGKSTLISRISAAHPKIADYPFTTLVPNLGVVRVDDLRSFVVADIPGLIEGASQGAGLGLKFLRHIERTQVFLHLISIAENESEPPLARYDKIVAELEEYDRSLLDKPHWVLLTKIDAAAEWEDIVRPLQEELTCRGRRVFPISAVSGAGLRELIFDVASLLEPTEESGNVQQDWTP